MLMHGLKQLYQKFQGIYQQRDGTVFSLHFCYLIFVFLIFGGIWCASLVNICLIPFFLLFSSIALFLINYSRFYGFYIAATLFLITYGYKYFASTPSVIWGIGLASSFLLSWGIFAIILSYIDQCDQNQEVMYNQLRQKQDSYNDFLKEKDEQIQLLEKEKGVLQQELNQSRLQLEDSLKKLAHLAEDLQILSDQKTSWSSEYALLHNEYVKLIMGDESVNAFSWASSQENERSVDSSEFSFLKNNVQN